MQTSTDSEKPNSSSGIILNCTVIVQRLLSPIPIAAAITLRHIRILDPSHVDPPAFPLPPPPP